VRPPTTEHQPGEKPGRPTRRRSALILGLAAGAALLALFWLTRRVDPRTPEPSAAGLRPATSRAAPSSGPSTAVRSTAGLKLDRAENLLPDHRSAKAQKDEVVKQWGDFLNAEKARLGAETFDPLAKRWLERPRLKALIEEWKALEQAWPERSEQERDGQLPHIRAMWTEAMTEFAAELAAAGHPTTLPAPR
jgi:hypothetical protein